MGVSFSFFSDKIISPEDESLAQERLNDICASVEDEVVTKAVIRSPHVSVREFIRKFLKKRRLLQFQYEYKEGYSHGDALYRCDTCGTWVEMNCTRMDMIFGDEYAGQCGKCSCSIFFIKDGEDSFVVEDIPSGFAVTKLQ